MSLIYDFLHYLRKSYWRIFKIKTFGVRVIISKEGAFFLVQHRYGGLWVFPGGGIKKQESLEEAAKREIKEEANIEIKSFNRKLGVYKNTKEGRNDTVTILIAKDWQDSGRKWNWEIKDAGFFHTNSLPASTSSATKRRITEYLSGETKEFSGDW